ncbi:MAG: NADH-quinone oxidoreductase subunit NuoE [Patescibacteria group bacterium]
MAETELARIDTIIDRYGRQADKLIPILQETQKAFGYLSEPAMERIADALDTPLAKVYGVATFYSLFNTVRKGRHIIRLCDSAPCHLRGADRILASLRSELGVEPGQTTPDGLFTLEHTSCLGVCDQAPAMLIDDVVYGNLTPEKIKEIIASLRQAAAAAGR